VEVKALAAWGPCRRQWRRADYAGIREQANAVQGRAKRPGRHEEVRPGRSPWTRSPTGPAIRNQ
jgi:hypothetical protein